MNYNEIIEHLKGMMSVVEFAHEDYPDKCRSTGRRTHFIDNIGECSEVNHYGGEGKGEDWWSVKYFPDHDIYIRVDGYYTSYEGVEFYEGWGCCSEVRPKEKTIIVYESV